MVRIWPAFCKGVVQYALIEVSPCMHFRSAEVHVDLPDKCDYNVNTLLW